MPRGNPKTFTGVRLDPRLMAAVLERTNDLTAAIEEGLRLWLRRARRAGVTASTAPPNPARRPRREADDA
jgi:hypothetical protein